MTQNFFLPSIPHPIRPVQRPLLYFNFLEFRHSEIPLYKLVAFLFLSSILSYLVQILPDIFVLLPPFSGFGLNWSTLISLLSFPFLSFLVFWLDSCIIMYTYTSVLAAACSTLVSIENKHTSHAHKAKQYNTSCPSALKLIWKRLSLLLPSPISPCPCWLLLRYG